ncbi:MAG: polymer-forming cytoskeletal protein [Candidatus Zixiibacteriota bacterium]
MKAKLFLILIAVLLISPAINASVFITDDGTIVSRGEIIDDDLYIFGNYYTTYGTITGDLTGFCYRFTNEGQIDGNANLGANFIELDGTIGQSARLFGQYVDIYGTIQKNVIIFGQEITLDNDAQIGRNLDAFGEVIALSGTINGDVNITAGSVEISGKIVGNVSIRAEEISLTESAVIEGNFDYTSPQVAFIDDNAKIVGHTDWDESDYRTVAERFKYFLSQIATFLRVITFFMTLIMGYFLIIFFRNITAEAANQIRTKFAYSLAIGFLSFLIFTFGSVIFIIIIIGIPIGLFLIGLGFLLFYIGKVFVAIAVGRFIIGMFSADSKPSMGWEFFIGLILLSALFQLPYLGIVIYFATVLVGMGGAIMGHQALNRKLTASKN